MGKIELIIPEARFEVDENLIEGLRYMGTLNQLSLTDVPEQFHAPLQKLFQYAKDRMKKGGRDRHLPTLLEKILVNEPEASTWVSDTDARHTIASFDYLTKICTGEKYSFEDMKRVLSSMIIHDCAYPETGNVAQFNSDARIFHMQEASRIFVDFANKINQEYLGFYSDNDVNEICALVGQHDNPDVMREDRTFLNFKYNPPKEELLWAHREADRLWMPDKGGYALDLLRRLVSPNPWYDNKKYIHHVIKIHTEEAERYVDNKNCFIYRDKKTIYRTKTGFNLFKELINQRAKEYEVNLD